MYVIIRFYTVRSINSIRCGESRPCPSICVHPCLCLRLVQQGTDKWTQRQTRQVITVTVSKRMADRSSQRTQRQRQAGDSHLKGKRSSKLRQDKNRAGELLELGRAAANNNFHY